MIEPQMINPYTYCFTTEVPYYQCDLSGKMKLSWLLKVMERAAGEHLEHIGLSYDRLYQEGIVFLLSKERASIGVPLPPICSGWKQLLKGCVGPSTTGRFASTGRKNGGPGELLAEVHTIWFMADPVERKILRPDKFQHEMPTIPAEEAMEPFASTRFRIAGEPCGEQSFTVQYSHLDVNGHLNNTVYGDLVCNLLPFEELVDRGIREFRIIYRHEARHGEPIRLELFHHQEEDCWYVAGHRAEGPCFEAQVCLNPLEK